VFRVRNDPAVAIRDVRSVVRSLDPSGVPPIFETIDQQLSKQMGPQRFAARVLGALGVIAALLTFFGVFVLVESMASLRRREMGVRAALGATGGQLGALVLNEALRLVAMGIAAGLVLAWLGAGLVQAFLFRVTPFDARTMAAVIAIIAGLSVVVSLRPARRAATIDPARVLREN
jgi:ABC-type antimicrobial peptide transport system permease subunit